MFRLRTIGFAVLSLIGLPALAAQTRITAGFGNIPPLHYGDPEGKAMGFVVDVLNEAARREGIEIEWKQVHGSIDIERALSDGRIDIFPAGISTQSRRAEFWVSEPWWSEDLSLLTRAEIGDGAIDWRGRRIVLGTPAYVDIISRAIPGAELNLVDQYGSRTGPEATATMVCEGKADGALMSHSELDDVLVRRPKPCRNLDLRIVETKEPLPLAIIARRQTTAIVRLLRDRIDDLARDGTLGSIAGRYPRLPARSAVTLVETVRLRYEQRLLWTALGAALLVMFVTAILLVRQVRIQHALRRSMSEQASAEQALRDRTEDLTLSNEELQAFAYSVSHDMQEPLRTIRLYTELLERRYPPSSSEGHFLLGTIRGGAARMQEMIDRLLLLSRIGRSDAQKVPVAIGEVLSVVMRDLEPAIRAASPEITIGSMPTVPGWPDRLSVLFQNLIGNALKYRREGVVPQIEISAVETGDEWRFAVRDNGIGFEQKFANKIFTVFKRLHANDKYGGTGVGLSIVKRVVERHGGRIWAEGRPNEGSTFYFTLPAHSRQRVIESRSRVTPAAGA
jgi:signal transduction histidine kinase